VFAVRVWFIVYLAWLLRLPGNYTALPPLGVVSGVGSLAGVGKVAVRCGRRPVVIGICAVSVATCLALSATAGGSIWIVLPLLILVQITSLADVGALAGGGWRLPIRRNGEPPSPYMPSPGSRPAFSARSQSATCSTGAAASPTPRFGRQASP
jgi:hypothetical protein